MELEDVAVRVGRLGDQLTEAGARLTRVDPGAGAFAADGPGALFTVGRQLHGQWVAALAAREHELTAHGAVLTDLAGSLRTAAHGYHEAEQNSHTRHRELT